jgi:hypothetical protein
MNIACVLRANSHMCGHIILFLVFEVNFQVHNMSSLKNAISRRTHKERAQPAARKKFGLLEKHKDYVVRAKDFHRKEKTIKV